MKIHSDVLTAAHVWSCAAFARDDGQDFQLDDVTNCGSRKRRSGVTFRGYAFEGRFATNSGQRGGDRQERAASWTAWGYFIAEMFALDPQAIIGQYDGVEDFIRQCESMGPYRTRYNDHTRFLDIVRQSVPA